MTRCCPARSGMPPPATGPGDHHVTPAQEQLEPFADGSHDDLEDGPLDGHQERSGLDRPATVAAFGVIWNDAAPSSMANRAPSLDTSSNRPRVPGVEHERASFIEEHPDARVSRLGRDSLPPAAPRLRSDRRPPGPTSSSRSERPITAPRIPPPQQRRRRARQRKTAARRGRANEPSATRSRSSSSPRSSCASLGGFTASRLSATSADSAGGSSCVAGECVAGPPVTFPIASPPPRRARPGSALTQRDSRSEAWAIARFTVEVDSCHRLGDLLDRHVVHAPKDEHQPVARRQPIEQHCRTAAAPRATRGRPTGDPASPAGSPPKNESHWRRLAAAQLRPEHAGRRRNRRSSGSSRTDAASSPAGRPGRRPPARCLPPRTSSQGCARPS